MSHQAGTNSHALKTHYLVTDRLKSVLETMEFQYVIGPGYNCCNHWLIIDLA